jgi:hypothetical protein
MTTSRRAMLLACGIALLAGGALVFVSRLTGGDQAAAPPAATSLATGDHAMQDAELPPVVAHMSPTCLCCGDWAEHMKQHGFEVEVRYTDDMPAVKAEQRVPADLASCHTAVVDGYIMEGHIPADVIHRFLQERPRALGLAVPGMPLGSPGMEGPYPPERYEVIRFDRDGNRTVYAER